jgi:hypothetical protein
MSETIANGPHGASRLARLTRRRGADRATGFIGRRGLPSDPPRSGPHSVEEIRGSAISCVSVLLFDFVSDASALERAIDLAGATNARLLVVAAPIFPRMLAAWALAAAVADSELQAVDVYEHDAVLRADRLVQSRVPNDLPVTIRCVSNASPRVVARTVLEADAGIVVIPSADHEKLAPISLRWHVRRFERALSWQTALRELQSESAETGRVFVLSSSEARNWGSSIRRKLRELAALARRSPRANGAAT